MQSEWIKELKLALINEDIERLGDLIEKPAFSENELKQAQALMNEIIKLIQVKKDSLATQMQKFQRAAKYFDPKNLNTISSKA